VPLAVLVRVAGRRWTVEETFQAGEGLAGLDQHQVRRWNSWHRWTTLAMLASAFLAVLAAIERTRHPPPGRAPASGAACTGRPGGGGTSTAPGPATTKSVPEHRDRRTAGSPAFP